MPGRLFKIITIVPFFYGGLLFAQQAPSDTLKLEDTVKLEEVRIKAKASPVSRTSVSSTLSQQQLDMSRGAALGDVLKAVSGVNVLKTGATISKPVVHGLHSNRVLILNNGVRLEGQAWGAEHAPEIDPFIAKRMHVVKGAESVRYGAEAIGGLILVEPPELPEGPEVGGELYATAASNGRSLATSAMLNGGVSGWKGFGWRVQGTFRKAGNARSADYFLGNTGLGELNYSAAMGYKTAHSAYEAYYSQFSTTLGIVYSAHVGTREDIDARIAAGRPQESYGFTYDITAPRQRINHQLLKLKAHYDFKDHQSMTVVYGLQQNHRKEFDFRRGDREALPITDLVLNTHTLDLDLEKTLPSGVKRTYGFNGLLQVNNNVPGTLANTFIPNYDSFTGGVFAIQKWPGKVFDFEAGLRYDFKTFDAAGFRFLTDQPEGASDQSATDSNQSGDSGAAGVSEEYYGGQSQFHNITGSAGALWRLNQSWHLTTNIGVAWRVPTANELFSNGLHHGAGLYEIGDPSMKSEQGYKWINAIKHFSGPLTFELDVYAQLIRHYIYSQPDLSYRQTVRGTYPVFRYRQTNASFIGADLSASYRFLPRLSYQVNAAIVRARDIQNDRYLPYIPADRVDHSIKLELDVKGLQESYIQFGHGLVARQHRYDPASDFAAPPPAYHLFNFIAGTRYAIGSRQLGANIGVENLFNKSYKEYMNRYRYYIHDMGRNITLRLNYTF
jgi:iron complex outermembrane receptor protein